MKKKKTSFWKQPADFYVGAGMIAEAPLALVLQLDISEKYLSRFVDWPPPVWLVALLSVLSFSVTSWVMYKLGLAERIKFF